MILIRSLDFTSPGEVNAAASFSMLTVLETLPEARRDPSIVPNLSVEAMAAMYARHRDNPEHRYLVAVDEAGELVGHAIALVRVDEAGVRHGYSYSRYVLPRCRRQGLGRRLLREALRWWEGAGVAYVQAHTHPTNAPLLGLFRSEGFEVVGESGTRWRSLVLRREVGP